ncbi:hypothetical protein PGT21_021905 [Puccinia graminis f. sp. tritici]|uniref:Uncharacterized protein n=1 Tax=Puccinia graminis f. sp. tritici TaxID=56615 RepID=A0A5B0PDN7_PUCGR|nr:hypothetical protein PGTUg99_012754 [Puccinia graminis f. sp. tritici]KAA1112073.1 hypothetical protein PGT21_021905 [Puccinia graminis f. sp. tritici]
MKSIFLALAISTLIARTWCLSRLVQHEGVDYYVFGRNFHEDDRANLSALIMQVNVTKGSDHDVLTFKNHTGEHIWIMDPFFKDHHLLPSSTVCVPWNKRARNIVAHTEPTVKLTQGLYLTILEKAREQLAESSKAS